MPGYNGVVYLKNTGISQATGVLLWTGKHILTAAHFFDQVTDLNQIETGYNTDANIGLPRITSVCIHPGWTNDPANYNFDLAIIELSAVVDSQIDRYQIYRDFDETSHIFERVGYSYSIDPDTGAITNPDKQFHSGTNRYDTTTDRINALVGSTIIENYQLSYDYDNGTSQNDAYGQILGIQDLGTIQETFARPGDSGGPAFINHQIAGIASYIFRYQAGNINPDITHIVDASYGELASDTRISKYQDWIDRTVLGSTYVPNIPATAEAVDIYPVEGDTENTLNYFLLQLSAPLSVASGVMYETLNGTATAGNDFVYTRGSVMIPAGETAVAIPVQIIADNQPEANETFSLRVYNPYGGIFPQGVDELVATHTIIDNDNNETALLLANATATYML